MPRTTIAAVLAALLLVAPAASARVIDPVYSGPTSEVKAQPKVMPERITDHPAAPMADDVANALAQENYYMHREPSNTALVTEQESTSGSGNQGTAPVSALAPVPADNDAPWLIVGLGIAGAALGAGALTVAVRRNRTRARVAV